MKIEDIMKQIVIVRKKRGITQEELANNVDKSVKFIGDIEIGRRKPSVQTFIDICECLRVDINSIIYGGTYNE